MCMPINEQDAAMDDMGAHLDSKASQMMACCPVNQDIAMQMHRVPDGVFIASDFVPHAEVDEELRDGSWPEEVKQVACIVGALFAMLIVTKLPFIDWHQVLALLGHVR